MQKNHLVKYGTYSTFLLVVIFLSVLSLGLVLIGVMLPIGMICYELGLLETLFQTFNIIPNVHINVGGLALPSIFNIPMAIIAGIIIAYTGKKAYYILKKYLKYVKTV